jgi:hypothetical protein
MQTTLAVPGLGAGLYASLEAVGITKCGTTTDFRGNFRRGLLRLEDKVYTVRSIQHRNSAGQPMTLELELLAGPPDSN